jgi:hypothetical protein
MLTWSCVKKCLTGEYNANELMQVWQLYQSQIDLHTWAKFLPIQIVSQLWPILKPFMNIISSRHDLTSDFIHSHSHCLNWDILTKHIMTRSDFIQILEENYNVIDWYTISNNVHSLKSDNWSYVCQHYYNHLDWSIILFNEHELSSSHKTIIKETILTFSEYFMQSFYSSVLNHIQFTFNELCLLGQFVSVTNYQNDLFNFHIIHPVNYVLNNHLYSLYIPLNKINEYNLNPIQKMTQIIYHRHCIKIQRWIKHILYKPQSTLYVRAKRKFNQISSYKNI